MNLWPEGLIAYSDRADALVNKAAAGKNSADQLHPHFHIAFYIGQLAAKDPTPVSTSSLETRLRSAHCTSEEQKDNRACAV